MRSRLTSWVAPVAGAAVLAWVQAAAAANAPTIIDLSAYADAAVIEALVLDDDFGAGELATCDVNGDRIEDLVIAASKGDGITQSRPDCGDVYLVHGARRRWSGLHPIQDLAATRIVGQEALDSLGSGAVCVDVNGDAYGDILLEAFNADSVNNSRDQAGQAHVIFGAPSLPALIDLVQPYGTVIYGAEAADAVGDEPATGDVNGDGTADLLLDAAHATSRTGNQPQAGKVHILFGRSSWPAELDLRTGSSVTIHGATRDDVFGAQIGAGDLDGDGIADLIIDAPGGDGPANTRSSCGDISVFRGRLNWPAEIDLAFPTTPPDLVLWGADAGDQFGRTGLVVADLDADGTAELVANGPYGDGPDGTVANQGEVRTAEPGPTLPATLDLRSEHRSVIYGRDAGDTFSIRYQVGDVNHDGTDDLIATAGRGDGPGNTRLDAGEVYVIYGKPGWPGEMRMDREEQDIIIYGAEAQDRLSCARWTADINDDGWREIALRARSALGYGKLARVYFVSPYDVDGDGFTQLADNCPLVSNADQADADGDARGDACAADWDGDGQADHQDCAPNRPSDGTPAEVRGVRVSGGAVALVEWGPVAFASTYDVTRGLVEELSPTQLGDCQNARDTDLRDATFADPDLPTAASGYFYLVRGRNTHCGIAGSYGWTSDGRERVDQDGSACP